MFKWLKDWEEEVKQKFYPVVPGIFGNQWVTNGKLVNPAAGTIFADTGPLSAGIYHVHLILCSSASWTLGNGLFELRDASNTVTIRSQAIAHPGNQLWKMEIKYLKVRGGQRLRLLTVGTLAGTWHSSIITSRLFPLVKGQ